MWKDLFFIFYQFFSRFHISIFFKKKQIKEMPQTNSALSIFTQVNQYKENEKKRFNSTYETVSSPLFYNTNIEPIFYNLKEYNQLVIQENNELEKKWKIRFLYESTPIGNIIMFYDVYKKGFAYYSDIHITYPLLNSIAMKFVRIYCCRDLFIDDTITPVENPSPFIQLEHLEEKKEKEEKEEKMDKKPDNKMIKNGPFIKIKKKVEPDTAGKEKKESTKIENHLYNVNKFIYMGKISNFSFLQKIPKKRVVPPNKNSFQHMFEEEHEIQKEILSYSEYRNLLKKKI
jgi:hypothetical protein